MTVEMTFVLVKPDGTQKNLVPAVKRILHDRGFEIITEKIAIPTREMVRQHLNWGAECRLVLGQRIEKLCRDKNISIPDTFLAGMSTEEIGETFENLIIDYNVMGDCHAMLVRGENAIEAINKLSGPTIPGDAPPDTIRGQLCHDTFEACIAERRAPYNVVHTADSPREAYEQIAIWFPEHAPEIDDINQLAVRIHNT